ADTADGEVPFGVNARNWAGQPDAGQNLFWRVVLYEHAAGALILRFELDHHIRFAGVGRTTPEDAFADVRARQRLGIRFGEFAPQRYQPAGVVGMVVAENNVFDIGKINAQLFGVFQHGVGPRPCVEQNPLPVNFYDGRKPPFADTSSRIARKHGRKYFDLERSDGSWSLLLRLSLIRGGQTVKPIGCPRRRSGQRQGKRYQITRHRTMLHHVYLALD